MRSKVLIAVIAVIAVVCIGVIIFASFRKSPTPVARPSEVVKEVPVYKVIGTSVQGRKIESFVYGTGPKNIALVGGMHGGYEWNSVLLAYTAMDYLKANPTAIPKNLSVTIIPAINPDGVYKVTGKVGRFNISDVSTSTKILAAGRFNAHAVDLNRNFDCKWSPKATWQNKTVSAGPKAFSEPESQSVRDFVLEAKPDAVVFWHSAANAVYASECEKGILPVTLDIMNAYSKASGYKPVKSFSAYPVTGDSEGWLASLNIPAITVELKSHDSIEWSQNLAGIKALLEYFK